MVQWIHGGGRRAQDWRRAWERAVPRAVVRVAMFDYSYAGCGTSL